TAPPPAAGPGDRGVAPAGGNVEHAPAGLEVGRFAEGLGAEDDARGNHREVAAGPRRLLSLLDALEVRDRLVFDWDCGRWHMRNPLRSAGSDPARPCVLSTNVRPIVLYFNHE